MQKGRRLSSCPFPVPQPSLTDDSDFSTTKQFTPLVQPLRQKLGSDCPSLFLRGRCCFLVQRICILAWAVRTSYTGRSSCTLKRESGSLQLIPSAGRDQDLHIPHHPRCCCTTGDDDTRCILSLKTTTTTSIEDDTFAAHEAVTFQTIASWFGPANTGRHVGQRRLQPVQCMQTIPCLASIRCEMLMTPLRRRLMARNNTKKTRTHRRRLRLQPIDKCSRGCMQTQIMRACRMIDSTARHRRMPSIMTWE